MQTNQMDGPKKLSIVVAETTQVFNVLVQPTEFNNDLLSDSTFLNLEIVSLLLEGDEHNAHESTPTPSN